MKVSRSGAVALGFLVAAVAVVAVTAALGPGAAAGASRATAGPEYYVAIGASETLSYQPDGPGPTTHTTDQGYTDDIAAMEQARWPGLQVVRFACPGLRMQMALSGGHQTRLPATLHGVPAETTTGRCRRSQGSAVGTAAAFIRSHAGQVVLVTLDLGAADLATCFKGAKVNDPCVTTTFANARADLPTAVSILRSAASQPLTIIGLDHEDPFLAYYLGKSHPNSSFAEASATLTQQFNRLLNTTYSSVGVRVAEVGAAFDTGVTTPAKLAGRGTVPLDVEQICALTWMCTYGNIHPNAEGYRLIANAISAVLPAPSVASRSRSRRSRARSLRHPRRR